MVHPMPIKKRRVKKSPNKNFQGIMRRQSQEENRHSGGGNLAVRYPNITQLDIRMDFISPEGATLNSEHRVFNATDNVKLSAPCPGRCGNGKVNLDEKISRIINENRTMLETKDICQELIHFGANDTCGCQLHCKITVAYCA
jgi:hypothetical protein